MTRAGSRLTVMYPVRVLWQSQASLLPWMHRRGLTCLHCRAAVTSIAVQRSTRGPMRAMYMLPIPSPLHTAHAPLPTPYDRGRARHGSTRRQPLCVDVSAPLLCQRHFCCPHARRGDGLIPLSRPHAYDALPVTAHFRPLPSFHTCLQTLRATRSTSACSVRWSHGMTRGPLVASVKGLVSLLG